MMNGSRKDDEDVLQNETVQAATVDGGVRGHHEAGEARSAVGARG